MEVKLIPTKQLFPKYGEASEFRVLSCIPVHDVEGLELNSYGNFTLSGSNISNLQIDVPVELEIKQSNNSKYKASYEMVKFVGVDFVENRLVIDPKKEYDLLLQITTKNQANSIHQAYPNFVQLVLDNKQDEIDTKKIKGVGKKYLEKYVRKIRSQYKAIAFMGTTIEWGIVDFDIINALAKHFGTPDNFRFAMEENPYKVLMELLNYKFEKADRLILSKDYSFVDSKIRAEYGCVEILKQNEAQGNTKLNKEILNYAVQDLIPECKDILEEVIQNSEVIYYNNETQETARMSIYKAEKNIAENLIWRMNNLGRCSMEWEKFNKIDGMTLTEEQMKCLRLATQYPTVIIRGSAGCVDCETEFFDGYGWKKISKWQQGDMVLQYNKDGTAELVKPYAYIKTPCDKMYHFETKYGLNQTLSPEHNVITISQKGAWHERSMEEVLNIHNTNKSGFKEKFITTFNYSGKGIDLTDTEIKVMCAVICDGSFYSKSPDNYTCRFHIKKDRKKIALRQLFEEYGKPWREVKNATEGYTDFYVEAPRREKEFTEYWYNCNNHQLQIICDNLMQWDGSVNYTEHNVKRERFSTTILATANFVQFAYSACGRRASILANDRRGRKKYNKEYDKYYVDKSIEYSVVITNRVLCGMDGKSTSANKTEIQTVKPTDGFKYCFTVPSHMLVLRRHNRIFISGNCGKSSAMKAVVLMLEDNGKEYELLAPTGKAAQRLKETTGRNAYTVNMFIAGGSVPQTLDYIILDEASMLGVELFSSLLELLNKNTRIILVCDEAQLASISCGNVVQDIIDSRKIPTARLTKVFRYGSSGLATIATDTRNGELSVREDNKFTDYIYVPIDKNPVDQIMSIYTHELTDYNKDEILILSPYNKGNLGTYIINKNIQERFNNNDFIKGVEHKIGDVVVQFKIGDKVINTKNNYSMPKLEYDEETGQLEDIEVKRFVANGDTGYIRSTVKDENGATCLVVEVNNEMILFENKNIQNLLLGYCISVHRVQGSESKCVIGITSKEHQRLLSRNLIYVMDTRAKEKLYEIGDIEAIEAALSVQENKQRDTFLKEMIIDEATNEMSDMR